jgi:hypothetical protein
MINLARNSLSPVDFQRMADSLAGESRPLWMLVDNSLADPAYTLRLANELGWLQFDALSASPLHAFGNHGPVLLAVPNNDAKTLFEALQRWTRKDPCAAWLSWLTSSATAGELQSVFAYLALALVDMDTRLHCRFADARVLPALMEALTSPQAARVGATVQAWRFFGPTGQVLSWEAPGATQTLADVAEHLALDAQQYAQILDASEPDIIFTLLMDKTSDLVPAELRGNFRLRLGQILKRASEFAVEQTPDRLQFVVLSLTCGERFHENLGLQTTWKAIREHHASLSKEMETWSDALWDSLEDSHKALQ